MRAAIACALFAWCGAAAARPSDFRFKIPDGQSWLDLSPGVPEENLRRASASARAEALAARYAAFAVEPMRRLAFHAVVGDGTEAVSPEFLARFASQLETEVAERTERATLTVLESTVVKVAGVRAARVVADVVTFSGGRQRQLTYYLPSRTQHAVLTFSAPPETFGGAKDEFDRAALATAGGAEPPARRRQKK
jgi:hypothetical protein